MNEKEFWEFRNSKEGKTLRFWQALRHFIEADKIEADGQDTFYWNDIKHD